MVGFTHKVSLIHLFRERTCPPTASGSTSALSKQQLLFTLRRGWSRCSARKWEHLLLVDVLPVDPSFSRLSSCKASRRTKRITRKKRWWRVRRLVAYSALVKVSR